MVLGLWAFGTAIVSFAITAIVGRVLIPYLHKLNFGQTILDEGPSWHKGKQGTPTMGGIMFIIGITITTVVAVILQAVFTTGFSSIEKFVFVGLAMALCQGAVGFIDDYIKVVKKRNLGLTASQKLIMQVSIAVVYLVMMRLLCKDSTAIAIPFVGEVDLGFFYYIIMTLVIVGFVNAVNLTDGIDGLDASITFFVALFMMLIATIFQFGGTVVFSSAVAGGCLGFLIWNFHPAKVFMGDTGSLFLGGIICAIAFSMDMQLIMIIVGLVYIIEMFSVMLQVMYFKYTKKNMEKEKEFLK